MTTTDVVIGYTPTRKVCIRHSALAAGKVGTTGESEGLPAGWQTAAWS